jgi:hypothetical protein
LSGEGFCGPKVVVVVLVEEVVVGEFVDEVAAVVETGASVVMDVEVVFVSLSSPLQAASRMQREAVSRADLRKRTMRVYRGCGITNGPDDVALSGGSSDLCGE